MNLPEAVRSAIESASQSGRKLSWKIHEDVSGTHVQLSWGFNTVTRGDSVGPEAVTCSVSDLIAEVDKATDVRYRMKDGKPGLGYMSGGNEKRCTWLPIAAIGKPQSGCMDFGVRGSLGIVISVAGREGEFKIAFQCLEVLENEFKLEKGRAEIVGLKARTLFHPNDGSPLHCTLIIEEDTCKPHAELDI